MAQTFVVKLICANCQEPAKAACEGCRLVLVSPPDTVSFLRQPANSNAVLWEGLSNEAPHGAYRNLRIAAPQSNMGTRLLVHRHPRRRDDACYVESTDLARHHDQECEPTHIPTLNNCQVSVWTAVSLGQHASD